MENDEGGVTNAPQNYMIPRAPNGGNIIPVIDIGALRDGTMSISRVRDACSRLGFFQIVNHGIRQSVMDDAMSVASSFLDLPEEQKVEVMSNDVHKPVRYGRLKNGVDDDALFLKHYAHPLADWIHMWPQNPPDYREKMGRYCQEVKRVSLEVMHTIIESLEINPTHDLTKKFEDGVQVTAINHYPPTPKTEINNVIGASPHTDHSCITIVHQRNHGLEVMDLEEGIWKEVPEIQGALHVHVGDHFEVLSNGLYKSVVHRVTVSKERTTISIDHLFSLGMDDKMEPAMELVDDQHPKKYRESSFRDYLNFLSSNAIAEGKTFLGTLKIKN